MYELYELSMTFDIVKPEISFSVEHVINLCKRMEKQTIGPDHKLSACKPPTTVSSATSTKESKVAYAIRRRQRVTVAQKYRCLYQAIVMNTTLMYGLITSNNHGQEVLPPCLTNSPSLPLLEYHDCFHSELCSRESSALVPLQRYAWYSPD